MLLTRLGAVALLIAAIAALSACGGSDSSKADSTTAAGGSAGGGSVNSADAKEFRKLMGFSDADLKSLQGKEFKVGAILPLSGPGANFAVDEGNGVKLAVDQMQKYMGMKVTYTAKDHKSGDPQAGAAAARELGIDGYGVAINSYYGVFGSTLKDIQQYKMLSFDPGGGTGNGLKGKDYFWGYRANTPDDAFFGLQYFKQTKPDAKRVALVIWDAGAAYTDPIEQHLKEQVTANGMTYTGKLLTKIGATDYASTFSKLKGMKPDIVVAAMFGADPGYFMKQYVNSGITAQVLGGEYVPAAAKIAGAAYDKYMFGADYFTVDNPPNPLSKFFLKDYNRLFGEDPGTFYQPNYYESTLAYLELARRVAAKGGDINSGDALNKEMVADATFKSVYGGDDSTVGTIKLDPKTHDPVVRPVGLFQAGSTIKQLAAWNIGGSDFKVVGGS
ncbi:MAG TPA: ABC transporter substrate-binding protein [Baekduia sp.]|uniref:ABC transporter substrate-binding protein n=1 Tax=Baekduia sp. TaxID=2600305 RepID=UPI002C32D5B2|nr:ABC transporter substrate-binding protein [Baekduia sp.]HMJ37741.1 ABC transporter substrate-binding protein [Baekduia sp.]